MTSTQEQAILLELHKLEKAGRFKEASDAYQHLLARHPGHPFLLWGLGRCLMHFGRRNGAAALFQQAVAALPTHAALVEDIAQRLNLVGHPGAALRVCDQAQQRFPERAMLALHRVDALRLLNRHGEALPVLRNILAMPDPPAGAMLRLIACLRQTGDAQQALDLAGQALSDFEGSLLDQAGIWNEMAHAQESLGEYRAAFDSCCASGKIAGQSPEARALDGAMYPRLLRTFHASVASRGLPTPPAYPANEYPRLVFQVGFPRSGTTLVESLLAAHPRVATSGEAPLWNTALGILLEAGLSMDTLLEDIPLQPTAVLERARAAYWEKVGAEFGTDYDLFVDKQPMNTLYLAHIRLLFPEALVVFCERDPRDVCLSCFFQWFQLNSSNIHFLDWQDTVKFYRQVMDYWLELRPLLADAAYTLRYEIFVRDFTTQARKLCDFLQLDWVEELPAFQEKNRQRYFHTPSNQVIHNELNTRGTSRWHHYRAAIAEVQAVLGPVIDRLGY